MSDSPFGRRALAVALAAAMLTGCGASAPQTMALPVGQAQTAKSATNADLLYVAHVAGEGKHQPHGVVDILTFPRGKPVAAIAGVSPWGICSDTSGNVWVVTDTSSGWYAEEFAHGGTTPVAKLALPKHDAFGWGCAVDPTSGNLAVMNDSSGVSYSGTIDVWPGARSGKPTVYNVSFVPRYAAYDDAGNLFISGFPGGSDFWLQLGVLPSGSKAVTRVRLDKRFGFPGGIAWDGTYVAVTTGGNGVSSRMYRVQISGSTGKVVAAVHLRDPSLYYTSLFCLYGNSVIAMAGHAGAEVYVWPYPAGGMHTKFIGHFNRIRGVTISVGS